MKIPFCRRIHSATAATGSTTAGTPHVKLETIAKQHCKGQCAAPPPVSNCIVPLKAGLYSGPAASTCLGSSGTGIKQPTAYCTLNPSGLARGDPAIDFCELDNVTSKWPDGRALSSCSAPGQTIVSIGFPLGSIAVKPPAQHLRSKPSVTFNPEFHYTCLDAPQITQHKQL